MRPGKDTDLRGQPRFNPAIMELMERLDEIEERLDRSTNDKERAELQRQLDVLTRALNQLNIAEQQRREEGGGALPPLPSTNETGLRGQPRDNPAIAELRQRMSELVAHLTSLQRRAPPTTAKGREERMREERAAFQQLEHMHQQMDELESTAHQRDLPSRRPSRADSNDSDDANRHFVDLDAQMHAADPRDAYFAHAANQHGDAYAAWRAERGGNASQRVKKTTGRGRNCVCHSSKGGAGWEDELAKAVERARLAEIDRAEADRLRAQAAAAAAAAQKATRRGKGARTRRAWNDSHPYRQ